MRFDRLFHLDLKLLVTLHILLEERSASRTAQRLHLTQSAVSKLLARLREQFDDPLFIRTPRGLEPTIRAKQLEPALHQLLEQLQSLTSPITFNTAQDARHFVVATISSAYHVLLNGFFTHTQTIAPNVMFDCHVWNQYSLEELISGRLDIGIMARCVSDHGDWHPDQLPEGMCHHVLVLDQHRCVVSKHSPLLKDNAKDWNLDSYLKQSHIQVCPEGNPRWNLDYQLARKDLRRHVAVRVPDFDAALSVIEKSDFIMTSPALFAQQATTRYNVDVLRLPVSIGDVAYVLVWHQRYDNDPGHRWLRQSLIDHTHATIF